MTDGQAREQAAGTPTPDANTDRASADAPHGPTPGADAAMQRAAIDVAAEKDLWEGRVSWRSTYPALLVWLLVCIAVAILVGVMAKNRTATYVTLIVCAAILVVLIGRAALQVWGTQYRLTTQRLFIRRGILTRTVDQTELMRVDDVRTRQTFIDRLMGVGLVELITTDRSDARVQIADIDDPDRVAEFVRQYSRVVQQKRTMFVEQL